MARGLVKLFLGLAPGKQPNNKSNYQIRPGVIIRRHSNDNCPPRGISSSETG